jgi:hypothetical protein
MDRRTTCAQDPRLGTGGRPLAHGSCRGDQVGSGPLESAKKGGFPLVLPTSAAALAIHDPAMDLATSRTKSQCRPGLRLLVALTACLMLRPAFSQIPTIEELEKRIEEAKKAKQEKQQPQAQGQPQRGDDGAVPAAKHGTLIVRNDAPCLLSIDGKRVGDALPAGARELTVDRGDRLIECTSVDEPAISLSSLAKVKAAGKTVVQLQLKDKVAAEGEQRRARIAAAQDEERRREEQERATTAKRQKGPLDHVADDLLRDGRGVIWSAADNGRDVSWDEADRYCTHRGMRLPSVAQLQSLVDRSGATTTPCQAKQCKVSGQFHLTGYRFWSKQFEGGRWAVFVHLDNGRRSFDSAASRDSFRALCVRGA